MEETKHEPNPVKKRKRRYAVVFGYLGTGYRGLQLNPGVRTIEADLMTAFVAAGLVDPLNATKQAKVGWSRCGRTDKGVHAIGQIVTLKLEVLPDASNEDIRDSINAQLSPTIRIFAVQRVVGSFHARFSCSGRRYQYMIPSFALRPPSASAGALYIPPARQAPRTSQQAGASADTAVTNCIRADGGEAVAGGKVRHSGVPDRFQTGEAQFSGRLQQLVPSQPTFDTVGLRVAVPPGPHREQAPRAHGEGALDQYQTGAAFALGRREAWARRATVDPLRAYRLPTQVLSRVRAILSQFVGRHTFHNFSPNAGYGDDSALRRILEASCDDPVVMDGVEFVIVTLRGDSFMLNQIRHMIGLVIDVARGNAALSAVKVALTGCNVKVPMAPATGLYLHAAFFEHYNKHQPDNQWGPLDSDGPAIDAPRAEFCRTILRPHIVEQILDDHPFELFLNHFRERPCSYADRGINPRAEAARKARIAKTKAKAKRKMEERRAEFQRREGNGGGDGTGDGDEAMPSVPKPTKGFRPWVPPGTKTRTPSDRDKKRKRYRVGRRWNKKKGKKRARQEK